MPRGNDPDAAKEFETAYGTHGNAEELIQASNASITPEARKAALTRIDRAATEALDLDKVEKHIEGKGTVLSASVRGDIVVAVVERSDGRTRKQYLPRDKAGPTDKQVEDARKAADIPEVTPGEPRQSPQEAPSVAKAREEQEAAQAEQPAPKRRSRK